MSKLFNLKKWLTVPDAAKHLSIVCGEEVTKADVLRLALDGHLKLSVDFVNHTYARCGNLVRYSMREMIAGIESGNLTEELKWLTWSQEERDSPNLTKFEEELTRSPMMLSTRIDEDRCLNLRDDVVSIAGIWDLSMIGGERLDVEHEYQNLTGGPSVTLTNLEGAFVERPGGKMCQLQADFDDNEFRSGSNAHLEKLKRYIDENNVGEEKSKEILSKHSNQRKEFLEDRKTQKAKNNYFPAGGLPTDAVWGIRADELRRFEQSLNGEPEKIDKPLSTTERNTLLLMIAALCKKAGIDHQEKSSAAQIEKLVDALGIGATVTDETARKHLNKIPDALGARGK